MDGSAKAFWIDRPGLQGLIDALARRFAKVLAPVLRDGSVVFDEVKRVEELPAGWRDVQSPGAYRLEQTRDGRWFGVVHGPESLKRQVFVPRETLLQVTIEDGQGAFTATPTLPDAPRVAVLGVRPCDVAGLRAQDRIFLEDRYPDPYYAARRSGLFVVAVNCTRSVSTCFCTSMGTGPEAVSGFDLSLTEMNEGFIARSGSPAGEEVLASLALPPAADALCELERWDIEECARSIHRRMDTSDLPGLLYENLDHPRWEEVAKRCLSCGNCTMVCPTCFCHDEIDEPGLDGKRSDRVRVWDSCFNRDHAQVHGHNFRPHIADRYRQWLTHKLASWIDQFGSSGCVGCGRCITWCPVGIDLVEEMAAIRGRAGDGSR